MREEEEEGEWSKRPLSVCDGGGGGWGPTTRCKPAEPPFREARPFERGGGIRVSTGRCHLLRRKATPEPTSQPPSWCLHVPVCVRGGGWASELVSCVLGPLRELPRWHPNPVQRPLTHACLRRAFPSDGHRRCPFYTGTRSRVSHGECEKARG